MLRDSYYELLSNLKGDFPLNLEQSHKATPFSQKQFPFPTRTKHESQFAATRQFDLDKTIKRP